MHGLLEQTTGWRAQPVQPPRAWDEGMCSSPPHRTGLAPHSRAPQLAVRAALSQVVACGDVTLSEPVNVRQPLLLSMRSVSVTAQWGRVACPTSAMDIHVTVIQATWIWRGSIELMRHESEFMGAW